MNRRDEQPETPESRNRQHAAQHGTGAVPGDGGGVSVRADDTSARTDEESVPGLFRRLTNELSTLFQQEVRLAKSEMTHAVSDVKSGISSVAMGGAVLYAGVLFLLGGIMLLLAYYVILPVAALIVGAVVTIIGAILLKTGQKKMQADSLKPDHTIDSVRKDNEFARRKMQ